MSLSKANVQKSTNWNWESNGEKTNHEDLKNIAFQSSS